MITAETLLNTLRETAAACSATGDNEPPAPIRDAFFDAYDAVKAHGIADILVTAAIEVGAREGIARR